jgi:hypothetical protein
MLSVGRALYIRQQPVFCLACGWEGMGAQLSTGLVAPTRCTGYLYAYYCSVCGNFDVGCKAKILPFKLASQSEKLDEFNNLRRLWI